MSAKKPFFDPVSPSVNFPEIEEKVLKFWKKEKIFERSVEERPKNKEWTFLDGPPFITGLPHYGSLLSSIPKDLFPRYKTMQGYRVRRVWGWDCHGLPAENKVEGKLGIKSKKEIVLKVGVKKFIEECKLYVSRTSSEWEWYVDHVGRWVDFKSAYKTMDRDYMETVLWVFKSIYGKGYIYKGLRVSLYCPHCETPISNFEVAMDAENYRDLTESATTYKYPIEGEKDTYLLAWSTTPWNKIVTPALAVNPNLTYVKVSQGSENYILAKDTLKMLLPEPKYKILEELKGDRLVGKKFIPHYDYYKNKVQKGKKAFVVVPADYVSSDEGTGVVTLAVYGEEDLKIMEKENTHMEMHVTDDGFIKEDVPKFGKLLYLEANEAVDKDLEERGLIYKKEEISHTIPHCWRCSTRLFHNPQSAWYVDIQALKPAMKKNNKKINWVPKHFKYGRFLKSMEAAPDWCISRSRYWGSPVPVWECECGERYVPGSIAELEELSGKKINDLHKPEIDEVTITCKKCGKEARRVPEVLDSWIEAGSAPYAERHFPFEKSLKLTDFFPPDFVVEYTGQIRAWFYVLHVISTALFDSHSFKNVLVTGVILGTDGRKMSKNYGNYPDPKTTLQTYGGDALRLYMMGSPVMKGEDIRISEVDYRNQVKGFLLILWNAYNFFVTYANADNWKPPKIGPKPTHDLDRWIISRMFGNIKDITEKGYEKFNTIEIVGLAWIFLMDLSHWYIRLIRNRVGPNVPDSKDKNEAYETLYFVLREYSKLLAPLIPFVSEKIYKNLTKEESVHLSFWPKLDESLMDPKLEEDMERLRKVAERGHAERKRLRLPVRKPLNSLATTYNFTLSFQELLKDELNVKKIIKGKEVAKLDEKITPDLIEEERARELVRRVQVERKVKGMSLTQEIEIKNDWLPERKDVLEYILRKTLAKSLRKGSFSVKKI